MLQKRLKVKDFILKKKDKSVETFIDLLKHSTEANKIENFIYAQRRDFFVQYKDGEIIVRILEEKWDRVKYLACGRLASVIFGEISDKVRGYGNHFDIPLIYKEFQEFMYEDSVFSKYGVPWEEWEDIARHKLDMLKVFMDDKVFGDYKKYKNYKCFRDYCKKFDNRCDKLEAKGYILYD